MKKDVYSYFIDSAKPFDKELLDKELFELQGNPDLFGKE